MVQEQCEASLAGGTAPVEERAQLRVRAMIEGSLLLLLEAPRSNSAVEATFGNCTSLAGRVWRSFGWRRSQHILAAHRPVRQEVGE